MSASDALTGSSRSPRYGTVDLASSQVDKGIHLRSTSLTVQVDDQAVDNLPEQCVTFHDVTYEIAGCRGKGKVILSSVSGILVPGLNAILGPSGSGKTTLLDILAGRKAKAGVSGTVLVNGERPPKNFKCISGYVVQNDEAVVMGTLSVRENLHFSAALRLPSNTSWKQRKDRVEKVIAELGLEACADTKIGTEFTRGVSGGERKRTNIGMELIIEPEVLFLDEPTTGLDAYNANSVVQLFKQLSTSARRIIILSIHQPRYSIIKLFDTLTLLSRGEIVYHGPSREALEYFHGIGFQCEEHENPADYFLDVITGCEYNPRDTFQNSAVTAGASNDLNSMDLPAQYQQSQQYQRVQEEIRPILNDLLEQENASARTKTRMSATYATNFLWQLLVVLVRSGMNILRYPVASVLQLVVMIVFALLLGVIFFQINDIQTSEKLDNAFFDRLGAFFFIAMNQAFINMSAVVLFIRQRALFIHENANGFYRVSAYFLAKVFADIIPMRVVPACVYSVIAYFMIGLQVDAAKFFIFLLTVILTSIAAATIAFAVSARASVLVIALVATALFYILSVLFGGFLIALSSLPGWLRWLKYLSIFRYALEALSINEIAGLYCYEYNPLNGSNTFACSTSLPENFTCDFNTRCHNGTLFLEQRGYETSTDWVWYDQLALVAISVVVLSLAYINLRLVKKEK